MSRYFNTAGPIRPDDHYYIEPLERFDLEEILMLIDQKKYFVFHAPRQTGKTTYIQALTKYLNKQGKYKCLYLNVEVVQAARENVNESMRTILRILANESFLYLNDSFLEERWKQIFEDSGAFYALQDALMKWCRANEKPIVLFIDEIDALVGDTLIAVLRQLRSGYEKRPGLFPLSIILCGVRDVKDYRIHSDTEKAVITGGSTFNIKARSLKMGNFTPQEIEKLYRQEKAAVSHCQPYLSRDHPPRQLTNSAQDIIVQEAS